jgi:hypothetical protein
MPIFGGNDVNAKNCQGLWSRREFLARIGWGGLGLFTLMGLIGFVGSVLPRVRFQPSSFSTAGFISGYAVGEVNEKFKRSSRLCVGDFGSF